MNYTRIFYTTSDDKHCDFGCDAILEIRRYDKTMPFDAMRQTLSCELFDNKNSYIEYKNHLKLRNGELHRLFYKNKNKMNFSRVLDELNITWHKYPTIKTFLIKARILRYDGNEQIILASDEQNYYLIKYSGS
jgi:hypothetical protein